MSVSACVIPKNIFSATDINEGKRQVSPSRLWKELSAEQVFAYQQNSESPVRYLTCGDLRAVETYYYEWTDGTFSPSYTGEDWYQVDVDNKYRINSKFGGWSLLANENAVSILREIFFDIAYFVCDNAHATCVALHKLRGEACVVFTGAVSHKDAIICIP